MFESLGNNLKKVFASFGKHTLISEADIEKAMRQIRISLLEADVSLNTIRILVSRIREKALGEKLMQSIKPDQMIVKIVQDEIAIILGADRESQNKKSQDADIDLLEKLQGKIQKNTSLNINEKKLSVILLCGLQGSGKTTTSAKLAQYIRNHYKKNILLCSVDVYRPAAYDQLLTLCKQIDMQIASRDKSDTALSAAKRALSQAKSENYDVLIIDTAGRLQNDQELMTELKDISEYCNPTEKLLVVDSLIGQEAARIAKTFNDAIAVTGVIATRMDGDSRGGAALSMKCEAGTRIRFLGTGEKMNDFDEFYPDRIASRILGMGDIASLVEKAQAEGMSDENMINRVKSGKFTMQDMLEQMRKIKKMGNLASVISMIPGLSGLKEKINDKMNSKVIQRSEAIISSMTKQEMLNPKILNGSRRKRIANGAGVLIQDVNKLIKQFQSMQKMMQGFTNMKESDMSKKLSNLLK